MKVVVLQPSYIPWRGYFDLIRRADLFVFYDDVQYDKHGWRNRNLIKTHQGKRWLSIPVLARGVTGGIPINAVRIDWSKKWNKAHLDSLRMAYARAPHFGNYLALLEAIYARRDELLADFTIATTTLLASELGFGHTRFLRSSALPGIEGRKTERLLAVLKRVGASHYISGPSASTYLEPELFKDAGITLEYMSYEYPPYPQLHPPYDPHVSILDQLFMLGPGAGECF